MLSTAITNFLAKRRAHKRSIALKVDPISVFIAERTRSHEGSVIPAALVYREYHRWSEAHGLAARPPSALSRRLSQLGYSKRTGNGVHWHGLDLLIEDRP